MFIGFRVRGLEKFLRVLVPISFDRNVFLLKRDLGTGGPGDGAELGAVEIAEGLGANKF